MRFDQKLKMKMKMKKKQVNKLKLKLHQTKEQSPKFSELNNNKMKISVFQRAK